MQNMEKLIGELKDWRDRVYKGEDCDSLFDEILSRYSTPENKGGDMGARTCKYSTPKGNPCNSRERHCTMDGKPLNNISPNPTEPLKDCAKVDGIINSISRYPTPENKGGVYHDVEKYYKDEPAPKPTEPLALEELAKRKGVGFRYVVDDYTDNGNSYFDMGAKARAFLEALPDSEKRGRV